MSENLDEEHYWHVFLKREKYPISELAITIFIGLGPVVAYKRMCRIASLFYCGEGR